MCYLEIIQLLFRWGIDIINIVSENAWKMRNNDEVQIDLGMIKENCLVVAICDDIEYAHKEVQDLLNSFMKKNQVNIQTIHVKSAEELLEKEGYDILFLDIGMPDRDGISVGRELRRRNVDCKIIMLTGELSRFREAFEIQAFRFLTKPVCYEEFEKVLQETIQVLAGTQTIDVVMGGQHHVIQQRNIAYIEANRTYLKVYLKNAQVGTINDTLKNVEKMLDPRIFIMISRGVIVNLMYVEKLSDSIFEMQDGSCLSIAVRNRKTVKKQYMEYDLKWGW